MAPEADRADVAGSHKIDQEVGKEEAKEQQNDGNSHKGEP